MREYVKAKADFAVSFWRKYEHHLGLGALGAGFIFDLILADSPDNILNNLLLLSYLSIAGGLIIFRNLRKAAREAVEYPAESLIFLLILQFCYGGLASNLLVLYSRSGTLAGSSFFIALLVVLIFGNEYLRSRYSQLRFNIVVFYFLLLTYCVIAAPTFIFHSIGPGSFLLSGAISLIVIGAYLFVLFKLVLRGDRQKQVRQIWAYILGIFIVFNILYFLNVIPPVPLSLKDIGIYHSVLKRSSGDYLALYEQSPWYEFWRDTSRTLHYKPGQSVYCFSSVYAPAELDAPIDHKWERYNVEINRWEVVARVTFPISGGREEGYRGFTATAALTPGQWRCDVETQSGALIGRTNFTAIEASSTPALSQRTL